MPRPLPALALALAAAGSAPSTAWAQAIDHGEARHLAFLRGEEKLARDVHLALAKLHPRAGVFATIAAGSEQVHADAVSNLLAACGLPDPEPATNDLPRSVGVFADPDFGRYFSEQFDLLLARGATGQLEALHVGAYVEELEVLDLAGCPRAIVEGGFGIAPGRCGLSWTDDQRIRHVYTSLLEASKSHLRSYVSQIERTTGAGTYVAQVLTQAEVDAILER